MKKSKYGYKLKKNDDRVKEFAKQRKKFGFDDTELWNLEATIAKFTVPRLKRYKEKFASAHIPHGLMLEEWYKIIDDMIYMFEKTIDDIDRSSNATQTRNKREEQRRYNRGLKAFSKYYNDLWY